MLYTHNPNLSLQFRRKRWLQFDTSEIYEEYDPSYQGTNRTDVEGLQQVEDKAVTVKSDGLATDNTRYILTRYERILRVEKVEYTIKIPKNIRNKRAYAEEKVSENKYIVCKVADIPFSEMLEEETHRLRKVKSKR